MESNCTPTWLLISNQLENSSEGVVVYQQNLCSEKRKGYIIFYV